MSQFDLGTKGMQEYDEYFAMLHKFFNNLEKANNLNLNLTELKPENDKRIFYSDQLRLLINKLTEIVRTPKSLELFLIDTKNHNFNEITIMQIYGSLLQYSVLISYANIENLFLIMLQNTKVGCDDIVKGTDPLGPLLKKVFELDTKKRLNEDMIRKTLDTKFRNSLAHGWLRIENRKTMYSENFDSKPKIMEYEELFERILKLKIFGLALYHVVYGKEWNSK
jgi:hypothetical protein